MTSINFKSNVLLYKNVLMLVRRETIEGIWRKMREGGNSKDGKVTKDKYHMIFKMFFKDVREGLAEAIFESKYQYPQASKPFLGFKRREDELIENQRDKRGNNRVDMSYLPGREERRREQDVIDLHDLVVSLTILSKMNNDEKLHRRLILKLE